MLLLNLLRLMFKLYYLVFHTTLSVLYQLLRNHSIKSVHTETTRLINKIANDDVVEALDMEIEALRNYRAELLSQANRTSTSATESAKLIKQAAAIQTKMMKLNEQVLKRRDKQDEIL